MKRVLWTNFDFNTDDWKKSFEDYIQANELDINPNDENALYDYIQETNWMYLDDLKSELNIKLKNPIIMIANLGLWNGRHSGYKLINSGNIKDCFYSSCDYAEWSVDGYGNLVSEQSHHDGTNYLVYRELKEGLSEKQIDNFLEKIYHNAFSGRDISRYTRKIGPEIGKVFGW